MSFEKKLTSLFENAIDIHDTVWYSKHETLYDAILRIFEEEK